MAAETKQSGPERMLSAVLLLVSGSTVFLDYWEYSREFHAEPQIWDSTLHGLTAAPQQYRIGLLKSAEWLTLHSPLAMRHALALFDLLAILIAGFTLRSLLVRSATWQRASIAARWLGAAVLVFLLEYAVQWLEWYQRPETLTIAAMLAVTVWLASGAVRNALFAAGAQLLLAFALGTIRADAAVMLHLGVLLTCLKRRDLGLGRGVQAATSALAIAAAAGVQAYIMRVLYPHATYGTTKPVQLLLNVQDHLRIVPFVLFLAPFVWALVQWARKRFALTAAQQGVLLGSLLFALAWCVLGKIDEVRIFLPFAFLQSTIVAEMLMERAREA